MTLIVKPITGNDDVIAGMKLHYELNGWEFDWQVIKVDVSKEIAYVDLANIVDESRLENIFFHGEEMKSIKVRAKRDYKVATIMVKNMNKAIDRKKFQEYIEDKAGPTMFRFQETKLETDFAFVEVPELAVNDELKQHIRAYKDEKQEAELIVEEPKEEKTEKPSATTLHVTNLPYDATDADIEKAFAQEDIPVENIKIIMDWRTGQSKGYAYVDVSDDTKAPESL